MRYVILINYLFFLLVSPGCENKSEDRRDNNSIIPTKTNNEDSQRRAIPTEDSTITPPTLLKSSKSDYPQEALKLEIEAVVTADVVISAKGKILNVKVKDIKLSKTLPIQKHIEITKSFAIATRKFFKHALFKPSTIKGKKSAVRIMLPIRFRLDD